MSQPIPRSGKIFIAGNLTTKPQLEQTQKGQIFTRLTLLINRFSYSECQWIRRAHRHVIIVRGPQAELCQKYLEAGSPLAIEGFIDSSCDKEHRIIANEVHFLGLRTMLPYRNNDGILRG